MEAENELANSETPRSFNAVRKRNNTEIKLEKAKEDNYLFLKKEL